MLDAVTLDHVERVAEQFRLHSAAFFVGVVDVHIRICIYFIYI